ncbi:MAG: tRNA preQ1(34) S-adenosylmethionine ribosyltransferase-isomerase QueA, partial [Deltaproteobacteria bacterium]|nr:tRNA preQ1(34) S-adenosylmethionine ribosyltransferase-isomerase QueA [Deltaproteobacteria bacterium]
MKSNEFYFDFPKELIAHEALEKRDQSRMMVLDRSSQQVFHSIFYEIPQFFSKGDVLILNNTKVLPARLWGQKKTGAKIEILLVKEIKPHVWEFLSPSLKGLSEGDDIFFEGKDFKISALFQYHDASKKVLRFPEEISVIQLMNEIGAAPLPPYIKREKVREADRSRYQTVFAEKEGAIAAPTASLHFTPQVLGALQEKGVEILYITLHVGIGTFFPIQTEHIEDHPMQTETYEISKEVASRIHLAKKENRPVTCVGTTTVRAVESYFQLEFPEVMNQTQLFIYPGYVFKIVDRLLTNFHQPHSTPLLLTSA